MVFEQCRSRSRLQWVTVWTPEGRLIGRIRLLEVTANVCFEYLQSWDVPNLFVWSAQAPSRRFHRSTRPELSALR